DHDPTRGVVLDPNNLGPTQTALYDQNGNLILPPGTTDLTGNPLYPSVDPRNLQFTDAAGHQYQVGQDGIPHQIDPVTGLPLHGPNQIDPVTGQLVQGVHPDWNQGIQPFNPDGPIFARDHNGQVVATYDAHDPNHAGWVGANSGGHVH